LECITDGAAERAEAAGHGDDFLVEALRHDRTPGGVEPTAR
jgi:hypothetical protein